MCVGGGAITVASAVPSTTVFTTHKTHRHTHTQPWSAPNEHTLPALFLLPHVGCLCPAVDHYTHPPHHMWASRWPQHAHCIARGRQTHLAAVKAVSCRVHAACDSVCPDLLRARIVQQPREQGVCSHSSREDVAGPAVTQRPGVRVPPDESRSQGNSRSFGGGIGRGVVDGKGAIGSGRWGIAGTTTVGGVGDQRQQRLWWLKKRVAGSDSSHRL